MELSLLLMLLVGGGAIASLMGGGGDDDATEAENPPNPITGLTIDAGVGDIYIQGKGGDDTISASDNHSAIESLHGDDLITIAGNLNSVFAGEGDDTVDASTASYAGVIVGGDGADSLTGSEQANSIIAGGLNSLPEYYIDQGEYQDDGAADTLEGLGGDDRLMFGAGDEASGGEGTDAFNITNMNAIFDADMSALITDWEAGEAITVFGDEETATLEVEDRGDDAVVLWNDRVIVTVAGAAGEDVASALSYNKVPDNVIYDPNYQSTVGSVGDDVIVDEDDGESYDYIEGYEGNDTITATGSNQNYVYGGDGDDVITVDASGPGYVQGGDGADTITGGDGHDVIYSNAGHNYASYAQNIFGVLEDDGDADVLDGGAGQDSLHFSAGDTATGGEGTDIFYVDYAGALAGDTPAVITDYEVGETISFQNLDGAIAPTPENVDGDAVYRVDGQTILIVEGAGDLLAPIVDT